MSGSGQRQDYTSKQIAEMARNAAMRDLIELHRGEYEALRHGYREHFKKELGYTDLRPAANRRRAQNA